MNSALLPPLSLFRRASARAIVADRPAKVARRRGTAVILLLGLALCTSQARADEAVDARQRLEQWAGYLASDELEGRGVGTPGIDAAADYLAEQFAAVGLDTSRYAGRPFQSFSITTGAALGEPNRLVLASPDGADAVELELGEDFNPLALGGSGEFDLPLVFVGYGISGKKENYDDYDGVDVEGKAVVILRHEPQQANPHSLFAGADNSVHAPYVRKLSNAYEHGAAAVIFCTDDFEIRRLVAQRLRRYQEVIAEFAAVETRFSEIQNPTLEQIERFRRDIDTLAARIQSLGEKLRAEYDPLVPFEGAGPGGQGREIPVVHLRRAALDPMFQQTLGEDLASLERRIDEGPTPHSRELPGWRLRGEVQVVRTESDVKNVVAVLEGEGPRAEETIVVGAHYDHLGWGGAGSFVPNEKVIHNGADDNASGAAVLLEVARLLATREAKLPRRVVFIAFTAEERGLIGSARYVREPLLPLENTVAMLNMDMVGRLRDDKLIVQGVDTADEFGPIIDRLAEREGLEIARQSGGFGPSDHASFYGKQIPVMHFFTGTHEDYHRPTDDVEKLNVDGMHRISRLVADTVVALAAADEPPQYVAIERESAPRPSGDRPYFGSIPDFAQDQPGYALSGVAAGGPAENAGLRAGDRIVRLGDSKIGNLEDFDSALRKHQSGDRVPVIVERGNEQIELQVTLEDPRG